MKTTKITTKKSSTNITVTTCIYRMIVQFPFPEENRRSNKYDVNFYKDIVPITINGGLTNNNTWQNILYIEYGQLCIYSDIEHVSVSNCSFDINILTELQLHRV